MKIKPLCYTIDIYRKTTTYNILGGNSTEIEGNGTISCNLDIDDESLINYFENNMNKQHNLELVSDDNDVHIIKNANIVSFSQTFGSNNKLSAEIEFMANYTSEITFDLKNKKQITIQKIDYDKIQHYYGKPEDMYYDEFYEKLVAVKI